MTVRATGAGWGAGGGQDLMVGPLYGYPGKGACCALAARIAQSETTAMTTTAKAARNIMKLPRIVG